MMLTHFKLTKYLAIASFFAVILAYIVIGLGAYTRLSNAGLGCPDWPGCYGHFEAPVNQHARKARIEMVHRYVAGTLGIFIFAIALLSALIAIQRGFQFLMIALTLFVLIIYQVFLGMWTVTLKLLPIIVTQHLLGGMCLLSLLWLIHLRCRQSNFAITPTESEKKLRIPALIVLSAVFVQIFLGAWTSTNYAAIVCPGFPFCHAAQPMHYAFQSAFNFLTPLGINNAARMTIQMTHRFGALVIFLCIVFLFFKTRYIAVLKKIMHIALIIVILQIALGVFNVLFHRPLLISLLHNLFGATLLLTLVTLNHFLYNKTAV